MFLQAIRLRRRDFFMVALMVAACGCEPAPQEQVTTLPVDDSEYTMMLFFDLSGSFQQRMAEEGKAYEFAMQVIDRYFRGRIGTRDHLIIGQISGTNRPMIWEGEPLELRQNFTAATFRDFLLSKQDPNGSRVHDSLVHAVEYISTRPNVANGKARSAVLVLSDMLDNAPDPEGSERRLVTALTEYGRLGGVVGLYYVDQLLVPTWQRHLNGTGLSEWCVESEIVGTPRLPNCQ